MDRRRYEQRDLGPADGFQFNARDEIIGYQQNGTVNGNAPLINPTAASTLALDGTGNRTQVTGSWYPNTYSVNTLNQYTHDFVGDAHYDPKGNLDGYAGWTLTYDAVNRLTELHNTGANQHIYYHYDALNRRVAQSVNGVVTSYVFDNWNRIGERATDGSQPHCYFFGGATNEVVASFGGGYPNYWYYQDGRGNTSHLSDNSNVVVERYTYDLNGNVSYFDGNGVSITASAFGNRYLFAGAILLPETGLYDMRNRIYFPRWGRFLQTDPIGFKGDASNLYRYCENDFVDHSDPDGLTMWGDLMNFFTGNPSMSVIQDSWNQQRAAGLTMGRISASRGEKSLDDTTIDQMKAQLAGSRDTTTAIVPTRDGYGVTSAATEVKVPIGGSSTGAFGYRDHTEEHFALPKNALRTVHVHNKEGGAKQALPSKEHYDYQAVQESKGRQMYFTSRYLARHGSDPTGKHPGNYIVLTPNGSRPFDMPHIQYRFDPRLILPPLPER